MCVLESNGSLPSVLSALLSQVSGSETTSASKWLHFSHRAGLSLFVQPQLLHLFIVIALGL